MSDTLLLVNIAATVIGVVVLIVAVKVDPVISLVLGALYLGISSGIGITNTLTAVTQGFGDVMAEIGMLIAFGVLIGALLHETGAIHRLVDLLLRRFGNKGLPYSLGITVATTLQSIYIDVLIVITAPLARSAAARMGRLGLARMGTALTIGLYCGLALMVPGAANLAIAALLHVPLGEMLMWGLILVVPTVLISTAIMFALINRGFWNPAKDELPMGDEASPAPRDESTGSGPSGDSDGPPLVTKPLQTVHTVHGEASPAPGDESTGSGPSGDSDGPPLVTKPLQTVHTVQRATPLPVLFLPLALGLILIAVGSISETVGTVTPAVALISNPAVALLIALAGTGGVARFVIGHDRLVKAMNKGFENSGQILILTGVGGSLAAVVTATGLGDVLQESFAASTVAPLLVVWVTAAVLHAAIGSVTLAALTAAGVLAPIIDQLGTDPALIALAAASGSLFAVHVTANAFWMLQSALGLTTRGTLKACTFGVSVASVVALFIVLILGLVS